jgi:hypothetical protein
MPNHQPSRPIALTDMQLDAVLAAARPLAPHRRSEFLEHVAREVAALPIVGDGALHRVIMTVQRSYFDPPDLGRANGSSKYR